MEKKINVGRDEKDAGSGGVEDGCRTNTDSHFFWVSLCLLHAYRSFLLLA
jgi:hypothetical protein